MFGELSKILIFVGVSLTLLGIFFSVINFKNIPLLPGDIFVKKENLTIYIPITTSILLSVILTLLFNIFKR
jgi:hypothetical protein